MMRLVDDRVVALGDHLAVGALPDRRVGAEQVMVDDHHVRFRRALAHFRDVAFAVLRAVVAETGLRLRRNVVPQRRILLEPAELRAIAGVGAAPPFIDRRHEIHRRRRMGTQLIEPVQAEIVGAALHVGRAEGHAQRGAQRRNVLEVDLLLEVLRARGDQRALAAEDCRHEIRERFARARPRFREQHAAMLDGVGHGAGHGALPGARLELIDRFHERPIVRERRVDRALQARRSGYSGNFRHSVSTSALTVARTLSSSGAARTRAMNSAI